MAALFGAAACQSPESDPLSTETPTTSSQPLAIIDGRVFDRGDLEAFRKVRHAGAEAERSDDGLFLEFVREVLLEKRADEAGIQVTEAEMAQAAGWLVDGEGSEPGDLESLRRFLKIQHWLQRDIHSKLEVEWEEVTDYFSRHSDRFVASDRLRVLEVLASDRQLCEEIRRRVPDGDVLAFQDEARRHSKGTTAQQGGVLGTFERGQLPVEFETVIFKLRAGQISSVVPSRLGYHLFMVSERVPRHQQKLYEVQREIYRQLLAEKERLALDELLKQITQDASIEIHDPTLRSQWRRRNGAVNG